MKTASKNCHVNTVDVSILSHTHTYTHTSYINLHILCLQFACSVQKGLIINSIFVNKLALDRLSGYQYLCGYILDDHSCP